MLLNERKIKILDAIIKDYIATAEPIGSRTIAKKFDFGVSSATIRNEMSDLEEMGYIVQPHLSSGRVPSDKGYRYYVDTMMKQKELDEAQFAFLKELIAGNINQIDYLMKETAKALAFMTNYTTVVTEPKLDKTRIRNLQLVSVDEHNILIILVTDAKVVKQMTLTVETPLGFNELTEISFVLGTSFSGASYESFTPEFCESVEKKLGRYGYMLEPIVGAVLNTIISESNTDVYTSGVKNLLSFPEFSDMDKARTILNALDEKQTLISLISKEDGETVQIVIGEENEVAHLRDCSIIKANYSLGGQSYGSIGVIGPTRMDYPRVVSVLKGMVKNINKILDNNKPKQAP